MSQPCVQTEYARGGLDELKQLLPVMHRLYRYQAGHSIASRDRVYTGEVRLEEEEPELHAREIVESEV